MVPFYNYAAAITDDVITNGHSIARKYQRMATERYDDYKRRALGFAGTTGSLRAEIRSSLENIEPIVNRLLVSLEDDLAEKVIILDTKSICDISVYLGLIGRDGITKSITEAEARIWWALRGLTKSIISISIYESLLTSTFFNGRKISHVYDLMWANNLSSLNLSRLMDKYNIISFGQPPPFNGGSFTFPDVPQQQLTDLVEAILEKSLIVTEKGRFVKICLEILENRSGLLNSVRLILNAYAKVLTEKAGTQEAGFNVLKSTRAIRRVFVQVHISDSRVSVADAVRNLFRLPRSYDKKTLPYLFAFKTLVTVIKDSPEEARSLLEITEPIPALTTGMDQFSYAYDLAVKLIVQDERIRFIHRSASHFCDPRFWQKFHGRFSFLQLSHRSGLEPATVGVVPARRTRTRHMAGSGSVAEKWIWPSSSSSFRKEPTVKTHTWHKKAHPSVATSSRYCTKAHHRSRSVTNSDSSYWACQQ